MISESTLIRCATSADADEICSVHIASIKRVCAKDYSVEVIRGWVEGKSPALYEKSIAEGNGFFVAEVDGAIVGFVEFTYEPAYIRAFYLLPEAIGRGIGSQLLSRAEAEFQSRGVEVVELNSTLTSVGFYESRGYENLGATTFKLKSGVEIPCVKMSKDFSLSPRERAGVRGFADAAAVSKTNAPSPQPSPEGRGSHTQLSIVDLGLMSYRDAWQVQEEIHERVHSGESPETILLVEHPPVITMGRRGEISGMPNLLAPKELLDANGVELIQTDRGGDITFHGPGQLVVYPIIKLSNNQLTVGGYVHSLERAVIATLAQFNIIASADPSAVGVWAGGAKIAAIGVRIRKGVSLHGIALNVTTDLKYFDLIIPCGLQGRAVTSMQKILGDQTPAMQTVKETLVDSIAKQVLKESVRK